MGISAVSAADVQRTRVTIPEALEIILESVSRVGAETVGIEAAQGRVLAEEVRSERLIPPRDNSAMDGFAVRTEDLSAVPAPVSYTHLRAHET